MTSIRFSFCGGESVTPHYIWQSNLFLIISVGLRKDKTPGNLPRHAAQKRPEGKFSVTPVQQLFWKVTSDLKGKNYYFFFTAPKWLFSRQSDTAFYI